MLSSWLTGSDRTGRHCRRSLCPIHGLPCDMRVAAIQTTAVEELGANLDAAQTLVEEAAAAGATLVVLPEYFSVAGTPEVLRAGAEHLDGPTVTWASSLATRLGIHLVAGSIPERSRTEDGRLSNTSVLLGPDGRIMAVYRKIHLFDVALRDMSFRESDTIAAGHEVVVVPLDAGGLGYEGNVAPVLGLSLCYDIRFPELYRIMTLDGATVISVPAAFTSTTGPAHWELLLRARAVEDQVFVIGAGQVGTLPKGMGDDSGRADRSEPGCGHRRPGSGRVDRHTKSAAGPGKPPARRVPWAPWQQQGLLGLAQPRPPTPRCFVHRVTCPTTTLGHRHPTKSACSSTTISSCTTRSTGKDPGCWSFSTAS